MSVAMLGRRWRLVHGEVLPVLRSMEPASVDAITTDPPYADVSSEASFVTKRKGVVREGQFFEAWIREHLAEWGRILKPSGVAWFTIDWFGAMQVDAACGRLGLRRPAVGVWHRGGLGMGHVMRHTYECFVVMPMDGWQPLTHDVADVWPLKWTPGDRTHGHSAEKPVELFALALRRFVAPGAVVLDPFAGSGSSGLAAVQHGCEWIGVEREQEFVETASCRLRALDGVYTSPNAQQADLFGAIP